MTPTLHELGSTCGIWIFFLGRGASVGASLLDNRPTVLSHQLSEAAFASVGFVSTSIGMDLVWGGFGMS